MKRLACAVSVTAAWLLLSSVAAGASAAPAGFKMFVSKQAHYEVAYPASWKSLGGSTQFFFGETINHFRTNVNIMYVAHAESLSLSSFTSATLSGEKRIGATIVDTSSIHVGTMPATLIEGRLTSRSMVHVSDEFASALFLHNGTAWEITLSSDPSVFWRDMATFRTMLRTFKFTR